MGRGEPLPPGQRAEALWVGRGGLSPPSITGCGDGGRLPTNPHQKTDSTLTAARKCWHCLPPRLCNITNGAKKLFPPQSPAASSRSPFSFGGSSRTSASLPPPGSRSAQ